MKVKVTYCKPIIGRFSLQLGDSQFNRRVGGYSDNPFVEELMWVKKWEVWRNNHSCSACDCGFLS